MHPDTRFHWRDREGMRAFVDGAGMMAVFAATPDGPRVAHVPVLWSDDETLEFHLSRGNALARHLAGSAVLALAQGPDAYVSPDWYGLGPDQVPTWNYVAVELEGVPVSQPGDWLPRHLDRLVAHNEVALDKPAWTRAEMDAGLFARMTGGILGFTMRVTAWRGTAKLNQNKPDEARLAAAAALEASGRRAIAHWMRNPPEQVG